jgi:hypothetical protein
VLEERCATVGVFAPPPHPAASSASAVKPALSLTAFISSSPRDGLIFVRGWFYEMGGYIMVSEAVTAL